MSDDNKQLYITPHAIRESSSGFQSVPLRDEAFARREIECMGEVTDDMTYSLCQQLRHLEHEDPNLPVTIFINSPGGSVVSGLAIYDVMQAISCPVRTVCLGMAASMGSVLFAAGSERLILPHAKVMIHDPLRYGISGSALDVKTMSDNLMQTRELMAKILAKHTGHTLEEVLEATRYDHYFSAEEAVEWGLADRVIDKL